MQVMCNLRVKVRSAKRRYGAERELGFHVEKSFFTKLLETFEHDAD